jgi:hypothetical protein
LFEGAEFLVPLSDGSSLVGELTKTIGSLNPAIKTLTGIDVAAAIGQKMRGDGSGSAKK